MMLNKYGVVLAGLNRTTDRLEFTTIYFDERKKAERARKFIKMIKNRMGYDYSLNWIKAAALWASEQPKLTVDMYHTYVATH
jgi:hypothetical protein